MVNKENPTQWKLIISIVCVSILIIASITWYFVIYDDNNGIENNESGTITVGEIPQADYTKIQWALDNATDGDIIYVWEGIYRENIVIEKTCELIGNGSGKTIINGTDGKNAVTIHANSVVISNFSIISAQSKGVFIDTIGNCTISDCIIRNNLFGISLNSSEGNLITDNIVTHNFYHGIDLQPNSDRNIITGNTVMYNHHKGIHLILGSSFNTISNNTISNQSVSGLVIVNDCINNEVYDNVLSHNGRDSIVIAGGTKNNTVARNDVFLNHGNGIAIGEGPGNRVIDNEIFENGRGVSLAYSASENWIIKNNISNNEWGLYLQKAWDNYIVMNDFSNNNCRYRCNDHHGFTNYIYHNNFYEPHNVTSDNISYWSDVGPQGNYWSDYTGLDNGADGRVINDGIGDTNLPHHGLDNNPYMEKDGWLKNSRLASLTFFSN
jgi:parallel beta-helix repeat protein